jgi:hypothetical protein
MKSTAVINNQILKLSETILNSINILKLDGLTLDYDSNIIKPNKGYFVSLKSPSIKLTINQIQTITKYDLCDLLRNLYFKSTSLDYIGFWLNKDICHIDISRYISNLDEAIKIGLKNDQLAVWDCENSKEITL